MRPRLNKQGVKEIYSSYEFVYAGLPSSMFDMFVCDIGSKSHGDNAFGNQANIVETRIANRVTPLHYGVRYHDEPLSFTLIFASEYSLDRYQIQEVAKWLTGYQEYQWLSIAQPDLEYIQFRCLVKTLTPISVGWYPTAFEAKIICDCPYGYSYPFERSFTVEGGADVVFHNESTARVLLRPMLHVELADGCAELSIKNNTMDGDALVLSGLPGGALSITVDNENLVVSEENYGIDLYEYFNYHFLELGVGDNELSISGSGTVTISGRYLYNVGA